MKLAIPFLLPLGVAVLIHAKINIQLLVWLGFHTLQILELQSGQRKDDG